MNNILRVVENVTQQLEIIIEQEKSRAIFFTRSKKEKETFGIPNS